VDSSQSDCSGKIQTIASAVPVLLHGQRAEKLYQSSLAFVAKKAMQTCKAVRVLHTDCKVNVV